MTIEKLSVLTFLALIIYTSAFVTRSHRATICNASGLAMHQLNAYVPDGLTPEEYRQIKEADKTKQGVNLGRLGPRGFQSRSMQAWQEAHEKGLAGHVFAPIGYRQQLKQGTIKPENVPYMVRGGSWDNSDVHGARRLKWLKTDKDYANGGYKKEQSVSILGSGPGLDWTGQGRRSEDKTKKSFPGFF